MKTRLLFLVIVTPAAVIARPLWRRRLGLDFDRGARSYWRARGETIAPDALRQAP